MNDEKLRSKLESYVLINETPVGTKVFPEDLQLRLDSLLSQGDFDALMQLIRQDRERAVADYELAMRGIADGLSKAGQHHTAMVVLDTLTKLQPVSELSTNNPKQESDV